MLLPVVASADAVKIGGIYYNLNSTDKTAEVTSNPDNYSGAVEIPASVVNPGDDETYAVTGIGEKAFWNCTGLTNLTIPNSVTSIGEFAFFSCDALRSVTIGKFVTSIGGRAFDECPELTDVYCNCETVPSTNVDAFDSSNPENITLHVPAGSVEQYKAAEPWSQFKKVLGMEQCAKPTITLADGRLTFSCETEGTTFVYWLSSYGESQTVTSPTMYFVSVYAKKEGFLDSETVTMTTPLTFGSKGDVDGDGNVNAVDLTKLIEILLQ